MPDYLITDAPYSADPTGGTDETAAIAAAISDCQTGLSGTVPLGGRVIIPDGNFLVNGALSGFYYNGVEMRVGISIPEVAGGATSDPAPGSMKLIGRSKSSRLIFGNDHLIMIHNTTMYTDIEDLTLVGDTVMDNTNTDWTKNQIGLSLSPLDYQDFSTQFKLGRNTARNIAMHNLRVGLHMMNGGAASSDFYRSRFNNFTIRETGIGIYLQSNPNRSITMTAVATDDFTIGDEILGATSGALAIINKITGSSPTYTFFYQLVDRATEFQTAAETITNITATGSATKNGSAPTEADPPAINRNTFSGFEIKECHIGTLIEAGDTNLFQHLEHGEIRADGPPISLVPDGIPTGLVIHENSIDGPTGHNNVGNILVNGPSEGNWRNSCMVGNVSRCEFYGWGTGGTTRTEYSATGGEAIGDATIVVDTTISGSIAAGWIDLIDVSDSDKQYRLRYSSYSGSTWTLANVVVASADAGTNQNTVIESAAFGSVQYGDLVLNNGNGHDGISYVTEVVDSSTLKIWPPIAGQTTADSIEINAVPVVINTADIIGYASQGSTKMLWDDIWPDVGTAWNIIIGGAAFVMPSRDKWYRDQNDWVPKALPSGNMQMDYDTSPAEVAVKQPTGSYGILATGVAGSGPSKSDQHTTVSRDLLSPIAGWKIWNTTTSQEEVYTGSAWVKVLKVDGNQECS